MDVLELLRALTLLVRLALVVALVCLLSSRRRALAPVRSAAWAVVAAQAVLLLVDNAALELLAVLTEGLPDQAPLERFRLSLYHFAYLLHAVVSDALPAVLIALLAGRGRLRSLALGVAAAAVGIGAVGLLWGTQSSWDTLLRFTRILSFIGIASYLGFCALYLLDRLAQVDRFLAGFVAVATLFELLLPVQEVFFQMVGRASSDEVWHLLQFLQLAAGSAKLVIVVMLFNALARRRETPSVVVPR